MKYRVLAAWLCASALPLATPALAEDRPVPSLQDLLGSDNFEISGSIRTRYESYENPFRPVGPESADLLSFRTIIQAEYDFGSLRIGGHLQDARAYDIEDSTPLSTADVNALELVQLYATGELGEFLGDGTSTEITGGRFIMNLGSKRLVASPGFRNTANGFTGARIDWSNPDHKQSLTLFYTVPQQRLPSSKGDLRDNKVEWDRETSDIEFWGGFFSSPIFTPRTTIELYLYGLDESDRIGRASKDRHLLTPGLRILSNQGRGLFDYEFEGALQTGNTRTSSAPNAPEVDVSAYTLAAEIGYTFDSPAKPRLALVGNIASGDDADSESENGFDTLFGIRRGEWGPSSSLYGPLSRNNIRDLGVRFEIKPSKRVDAFVSAHAVWLDSLTDSFAKTGIVDPTGMSGRFAGNQVETRVRFWIIPDFLQLDVGGAILAKGEFLRNAPNVQNMDDTHYGYADIYLHF